MLKALAAHYVMRTDQRASVQDRQRELLLALVTALAAGEGRDLEPDFAADFAAADDDTVRRRAIIDQVASLTDVSARSWALRLLD